jgi:hypothetical protein
MGPRPQYYRRRCFCISPAISTTKLNQHLFSPATIQLCSWDILLLSATIRGILFGRDHKEKAYYSNISAVKRLGGLVGVMPSLLAHYPQLFLTKRVPRAKKQNSLLCASYISPFWMKLHTPIQRSLLIYST